MTALSFAAEGVRAGRVRLEQLAWPLSLADRTLSNVLSGKPATFSWQELLQSQPPPAKQLVSDADAGMAVSDRALDAAKGLHQKPNRHRRELDVEFTKQPYQPIVRQHAVDRERHFRLKLIEESTNARATSTQACAENNIPALLTDVSAIQSNHYLNQFLASLIAAGVAR
jgi:hypothetical protein